MAKSSNKIDVYLEIGKKRTFAGAMDWPGWSRSGRDEDAALQALIDYGSRYAQILGAGRLGFEAPADIAALAVVERLKGNATTDFGAPDVAPSADARPLDKADLERFQTLFKLYWQAFDAVVDAASGKELRKGPRGGGRKLEGIVQHVLDVDKAYLRRLARKVEKGEAEDLSQELSRTRQAILEALEAAVRGEIPEQGPRGGQLWKPRYFVRRLAWHELDHLWEIEDRII
jgi:hypothetical protein